MVPPHVVDVGITAFTLLVLGVVAFMLVGSNKPSVEAACRDYVHGVFEEDEAQAIDAVERLADGYSRGDEVADDEVDWSIAGLASVLKTRVLITGHLVPSEPTEDYVLLGLLELCANRIGGFKTLRQVEENARAMDYGPLTATQLTEITNLLEGLARS